MVVRLKLQMVLWHNLERTVISICESAVVSAGGMVSINGYKAIVEMQFADFVSTGFNPIVNLLAKSHYRWLEKPMLWCACLAAVELKQDRFIRKLMRLGLQNSGLKVVYPAFPYDAKGLLNESISDLISTILRTQTVCTARFIRKYPPITTPYLSDSFVEKVMMLL
jgi:pyruvate/2-oxoglutarate/acetoin dehydrogenase E1 component